MRLLIIIVLIAVVVSYFLLRKQKKRLDDPFDEKQIKRRKEIMDSILGLAHQKSRITVQDVASLLNFSDQEALRYLGYLVNLNKIKRISERGRSDYYTLQ